LIQINNVVKTFPSVKALDNISLTINKQDFFGLLGPNGAGKSTLMNLLIGYINPDSGKILIDGHQVSKKDLKFRENIGYIPQTIALYDDLTPVENLRIFGSLYSIPPKRLNYIIAEKLQAVQLYDRKKDKVKTFSGGMKRRLNLAAGLLYDPPIILCDEPTVGVDPQSRNAIFDYLRLLNSEGKTIIYTTHYMEEAERLCSRIAIIDAGRIITIGSLEELLNQLPYEESIFISKNKDTSDKLNLFNQFGNVIESEDKLELKPQHGFILSEFFRHIEKENISYRNIELHKPSLEALFLYLTGRKLRD